jgi:hypothetical protein
MSIQLNYNFSSDLISDVDTKTNIFFILFPFQYQQSKLCAETGRSLAIKDKYNLQLLWLYCILFISLNNYRRQNLKHIGKQNKLGVCNVQQQLKNMGVQYTIKGVNYIIPLVL